MEGEISITIDHQKFAEDTALDGLKRIEAHITFNFVAYKVCQDLERQLKQKNAKISSEQAIEIAKSIHAVEFTDSTNGNIYRETLLLMRNKISSQNYLNSNLGVLVRNSGANVFISKAIPTYEFMPYAYGSDLVETVILKAKVYK